MKIIGHRGARGLVTENSLASFKKALELGVDGVEFDVWTTKDGVAIVHHDSNLVRMTGFNGQIFDMAYAEIKKHKLKDGQTIPTAEKAIKAIGSKPIYLEIKDYFLSPAVLDVLDKFSGAEIYVTSFNHNVLFDLKTRRPKIRLYVAANWHPTEAVILAKKKGFYGINLSYKIFSPFTYWLARRNNLDIKLFTINNTLYVRLLKILRVKVGFTTDRPDKMIRLIKR